MGHTEMVRRLVLEGADVNASPAGSADHGKKPVDVAREQGNFDVVSLLDSWARLSSPVKRLFVAAFKGDAALAESLIEGGTLDEDCRWVRLALEHATQLTNND